MGEGVLWAVLLLPHIILLTDTQTLWSLLFPNLSSPQPHRSSICLLIPATSRKQEWGSLEDTLLYQFPLASLGPSIQNSSQYSFRVFVGYDAGDALFDNSTTLAALAAHMRTSLPSVAFEPRRMHNPTQQPVPVLNSLSRAAYRAGCYFMYHIDDDTEFVTPDWANRPVSALQSFTPPLWGAVGPTCHEGNTAVLTHDFVHRTHLDLFRTHYPPQLTTWWFDDWITHVYGEHNTRHLPDVVVRDHPERTHLRYTVNWASSDQLPALIAEGRKTVREAMLEAFMVEKW
jgi:hypothetical protein